MRQNTAAWQHDAVWAVQQDNGAKALMEVGTRNTRFTSVRHGNSPTGPSVTLVKLKNGAASVKAGLTKINVLQLAYDCVDFLI